MGLGLSEEYLEKRKGFVMASDVKPIMEGDWRTAWLKKKGRLAEDDLSNVMPVILGSYTEPFNLWRYMVQTGRDCSYYSDNTLMQMIWADLTGKFALQDEFQQSTEYPWMACSLDGFSTTSKGFPCVLDAKHVGTFNHDKLVTRYLPAMTHQAIVMGVDHWALSVLCSNSKLEVIEQEVDLFYASEVIEQTRRFWDLVEQNIEPDEMEMAPTVPTPKPQPRLRVVDLDKDCTENWAGEAIDEIKVFASTNEAAKLHAITRDNIKKLVPEDVGTVTRGKFRLSRSINGSLTMAIRGGKDEA